MIDTSGHHIVYGVLTDYLTGESLPDTDDERIRQDLARLLVEEHGFAKEELEPRLLIVSEIGGKRVESLIDLVIRIQGQRLCLLRYGPGSLVTREKAAIAAARILDPQGRIPLAVVTNGRDAELLDTDSGRVLATGMGAIFDRTQALQLVARYPMEAYPDPVLRDQALRILNVFDEEICCAGGNCTRPQDD
jgi:hypothetical protein